MPKNKIINYKTECSGITSQILSNVSTTLSDVHDFLKKNFSKDTIIVGHSLESDFVAIQLIHENVIDTSIIYRRQGYPIQKHGLKWLASGLLKKEIQNQSNGHNSIEDAIASLELAQKKISSGNNKPQYISFRFY